MGQMTIGGVDIDDLGLKLLRTMELKPPEPKTVYVSVPGGDGVLDLTEAATGDVAYSNREQAFVFDATGDFEAAKTRVSNMLHGRRLEYTVPGDPGYTYKGRFAVEEYEEARAGRGRIRIAVSADPYKRKPDQTFRVRAGGGADVRLPSGRMRVSPVFECSRPTVVTCNGVSATIPAGAGKVRGLYLHEGKNDMYVNSTPDLTAAAWGDFASDTWGDYAGMTWAEVAWRGHERPTGDQYDVFVTYEWGDL